MAIVRRWAVLLAAPVALAAAIGCGFDSSGLGSAAFVDAAAPDVVESEQAFEALPPEPEAGADADAVSVADADAGADAVSVADAAADAAADTGADAVDATDAAPPLVARLNIDGADLDGVDYPGHWSASPVPGACGPNHYENGPIHGTNDPGLFGGEAWGNPLTCAIGGGALAPGTYRVRMYFAEIYFGPGCPAGGAGTGARIFSIALEGATVLADFDVFAASGGCLASTTSSAAKPVVETFDVVVTDGTLNLVGTATKNNAKISALEVYGPM